MKTLRGHVPPDIAKLHLQPTGRVPAANDLHLAIELALHDKDTLTNLLRELYDPASTNFHRYLTPQQFAGRFAPPETDYEKVMDFARAHGLEVDQTYANRLVLDVTGKVPDIERAFHVTLRTYQHPTEDRNFFAPDVEPSLEASVPILDIDGLSNFRIRHSSLHPKGAGSKAKANLADGSGPNQNYIGFDFRRAYVPGVSLTGAGQTIGLFEDQNWNPPDIAAYETLAGLPTVAWTSTHTTTWVPASGSDEISADIEMVISMAPGASFAVFQADFMSDWLGYATGNPQILQFSCSFTDVPYNIFGGLGGDGGFMQMAAQGQSMFQSSGDGDANTIEYASDSPYLTSAGGTDLAMNGSGASYASESVWNVNRQSGEGSCGGVSATYSIPYWQAGVNMAANGGSTTKRNVPDVAMVANNVWVIFNSGQSNSFGGTSLSSPLWAGFAALVNQQAQAMGLSPIGFLNPALYAIAQGPNYTSAFHDITVGDNEWSGSLTQFSAVPGYDLCTGLGTPNGMNLINALLSYRGAGAWVDFNSGLNPPLGAGTYYDPFLTLGEAVNAVSSGGNIWIRTAGTSAETLTISKPVTIHAYNGAASVGQ